MKKLGKMNFERISRAEMKNIIAGNNTLIKPDDLNDGGKKCGSCSSDYDCGSGCNACQTGNSGSTPGYCYKIQF